ncbi:thiol-disulfide isomerase/thioredoxin [Pedobacter sp. AK017]|uniref:TlpA family protein disulfide reductase n=1 Tax=Pedobacter sp. AK017 TaxID=2723073 RepID=UPI00160D5A64|nr:thioredoxin-like domain-containing protein [Pedobacter sp. AK017]MBB5440064.1 thiol-disulfide isomerase/thioredoxin [Pedobacter sp. AK017]
MKNLFKALFALAMLYQQSIVFAQRPQPTFKGTVSVDGKRSSGIDTIEVIYLKPYSPYRTNYESISVTTDTAGNFCFKLPYYIEPGTMGFWMMSKGRAITEMARKRYFFENTDVIEIDIRKTASTYTINFAGKGAEKYTIVNKLAKLGSPAEIDTEFRDGAKKLQLGKKDSLETKLHQLEELTRQLVRKKEVIINNSRLSERMKKMITYEYAPIYSDWKLRMEGLYMRAYRKDPGSRLLIKKNFSSNKEKFKNEYNSDLALCPNHLNFLALEEARDLLINSPTDSISFKELYNLLTNKYSGLIRERLIANLFLGFSGYIPEMKLDNQVIETLMEDGKKYITIPFVKRIYTSQQKLAIGKRVYNASFKDLKGNSISLSSLKNKVVFIDVWFTGCGACAKFHQGFHQVFYPLLKGNDNFVYLSISADSSIDKWKQGIGKVIYTSMDYLNVRAENGFNHPFLKHYELSGAPFLLLLNRKGQIYANIINGAKDAYELIQEALKADL